MTLRVELLIEDGTSAEEIDAISSLMVEHAQVPRAGDRVAGRAVIAVEWRAEGYDRSRPMLVARVTLAEVPDAD